MPDDVMFFIVSLLISFVFGALFTMALAQTDENKKRKKEAAARTATERKIRHDLTLEHSTFNGVHFEIDADYQLLKAIGENSSKTFRLDQVNGEWEIFVYNEKGERKLMSPEMFEQQVHEVLDHPAALRAKVGFEPAESPSS